VGNSRSIFAPQQSEDCIASESFGVPCSSSLPASIPVAGLLDRRRHCHV
jgi:hypothetical protein